MKDDDLLNELGALAKAQRDAPVPPELQQPLGEDFEKRLLASLPPLGDERPNVVPLRSGRAWARRAPLLVPLALAAGLALFVFQRNEPGSKLPRYSFETGGSVAHVRSSDAADEAAPLELTGDTRLELVLRPEAPVDVPVTAHLFLVQGSKTERLPVTPERSEDGAFRFVLSAEQVLDTAEGTELVAWVGRVDESSVSEGGGLPAGGQLFRRGLRRK